VEELPPARPSASTTDVLSALRSAGNDPAGLSDDDTWRSRPLMARAGRRCPRCRSLRRDVVGDEVTFVVKQEHQFTNICYTGLPRSARSPNARATPMRLAVPDEVADRAWRRTSPAPPRSACRAASIPSSVTGVRRPGARGQGAGAAITARLQPMRSPMGEAQRHLDSRVAESACARGLVPSLHCGARSSTTRSVGLHQGHSSRRRRGSGRHHRTRGRTAVELRRLMYGHVDTPKTGSVTSSAARHSRIQTGGFSRVRAVAVRAPASPLYCRWGGRVRRTATTAAVHALPDHVARQDRSHPDQWVKLGVERTR